MDMNLLIKLQNSNDITCTINSKNYKVHPMLYEQKICCQWSNVKENNKKNEIEYQLKNNNNINSMNQIRPESGINSFSPKTNSFLDRSKNIIIKCSIQEGIRLWWERIYTRFWPGLIHGINIIIIFNRDSISFFLLFSFTLLHWQQIFCS